jgi:D-threonate/D-erythronate kinase
MSQPSVQHNVNLTGQGKDETAAQKPLVFLVADDLTGACDSTSAFAVHGFQTRVFLKRTAHGNDSDEVIAIQTGTRDMKPEQAVSSLRQALALRPASTYGFKKIDSVFRGNTLPEILQTLDSWPYQLAILAPAYPATGRYSVDGVLHCRDFAGETNLPVVSSLVDLGLSPGVIPTGLTAPLTLAKGKTVIFVGSTHPVTDRQLRELSAESGAEEYDVCSDSLSLSTDEAPLVLRVPCGLATTVDVQRAVSVISQTNRIACMVMTGGDTAVLVCEALGIESLDILGEYSPGLPIARAEGGSFSSCTVVLKSGGFGSPSVLCDVVSSFSSKGRIV